MKKKLFTITMTLLLAFGCAACGGSDTEAPVEETPIEESSPENDVFDFTMDEFVASVDGFLNNSDKKLLSTYEITEDGNKITYTLSDGVYLYAEVSEATGKVKGIILHETMNTLSDENINNYTALIIDTIASVDPHNLNQIVTDLNLMETNEGTYFAEGTTGNYIYSVEGNIAKVSILPAAAFE